MNKKYHLSVSLGMFVLTFLISFINNTWMTSIIRGIYGFILMFILVVLLNFVFSLFLQIKDENSDSENDENAPDDLTSSNDSHRGTRIDLTTPEEMHPTMSGSKKEREFVPWNQEETEMNNIDPKQVARTITQFSDD